LNARHRSFQINGNLNAHFDLHFRQKAPARTSSPANVLPASCRQCRVRCRQDAGSTLRFMESQVAEVGALLLRNVSGI
jgi:hypothetical protein